MKRFALVILSGTALIGCNDRGAVGSIAEVEDADVRVVREIMNLATTAYAGDGLIRPARVVLGSWETLAAGGSEEWRQRLVGAIREIAEAEAKSPSEAPWLLAFEKSERPDFLGWLPGSWDGSVDLWLYDKEDMSDCGRGFSILIAVHGRDWKTELNGEAMMNCLDPARAIEDVEVGEAPFRVIR